jgi:hypothetical protein
LDCRSTATLNSKGFVSLSTSGNDSDSEVDKNLERKKQSCPEKLLKKQKTGKTWGALASSKQGSSK